MKAKKNPKADLKRNSLLYFMIGLTAVLCMSYTVMEWKTYDFRDGEIARLNEPDELWEKAPVTLQKLPPPPPPKIQITPELDIVDNDKDIIETVIKSTESDTNSEIIPLESVAVAEIDEPEEIPFAIIEEVPVFPGCENAEDKRSCFQEMVQKHVRRNFRYPEAAIERNQQGKVYVQFTVQKDGSIDELKLRGPHQVLENEAIRIISKLPQMTPGKQRGTAVKVPFSIPINFVLQ